MPLLCPDCGQPQNESLFSCPQALAAEGHFKSLISAARDCDSVSQPGEFPHRSAEKPNFTRA
jgi:hypothetical protein